MMAARVLDEGLSFGPPSITPHVYLAAGPSGWPETFNRKQADAALLAFIHPLPLEDVIETFLAARALAEDPTVIGWFTVIGHLGRLMNVHPKLVPAPAGVAFWAQVLLAQAPANPETN